MAAAARPWWIGPVALGVVALAITRAPQASGEFTGDLISRAWAFADAVLPDGTLTTEPDNTIPSPSEVLP